MDSPLIYRKLQRQNYFLEGVVFLYFVTLECDKNQFFEFKI